MFDADDKGKEKEDKSKTEVAKSEATARNPSENKDKKNSVPPARLQYKDRLLEGIEEARTGWFFGYPDNSDNDDPTLSEFRIAINPSDPDNLKKAYLLLINIFEEHQVFFKMMGFDEKVLPVWDPTLINMEEGETLREYTLRTDTDRDQRGKEICVYFRPTKDDNSPVFWQNLMLACWKKLQDEGVKLGYVAQPYGDARIEAEEGILVPFTYSLGLAWKQRHGILSSQPLDHDNLSPFHDIRITKKDIIDAGLIYPDCVDAIQLERQRYYQSKLAALNDSLTQLNLFLTDMPFDMNLCLIYLARLQDILNLLPTLTAEDERLPNLKQQLEEITKNLIEIFPYVADYNEDLDSGGTLKIHPDLTQFFMAALNAIDFIASNDSEKFKQKFEKAQASLDKLNAFYQEETKKTTADFLQNPLSREWLEKQNLVLDIREKVNSQPRLMQCVFRKLVHCTREKDSIDLTWLYMLEEVEQLSYELATYIFRRTCPRERLSITAQMTKEELCQIIQLAVAENSGAQPLLQEIIVQFDSTIKTNVLTALEIIKGCHQRGGLIEQLDSALEASLSGKTKVPSQESFDAFFSFKEAIKRLEINNFLKPKLQNTSFTVNHVTKEVVGQCDLMPSHVSFRDTNIRWLNASDTRHDRHDLSKNGKWILKFSKDKIDDVWEHVKQDVANGNIWQAKVSTLNEDFDHFVLLVYAFDSNDVEEMANTYEYLVEHDYVSKANKQGIKYKADDKTRANDYSAGEHTYNLDDISVLRKKHKHGKTKTSVALAQSQKQPLAHDYSQKGATNARNSFIDQRFECFARTASSASISGSTFANNGSNSKEGVLDASCTDYLTDTDGVRIGIAMATADGCGHFFEKNENLSTAYVSSRACEEFVYGAQINPSATTLDVLPKTMQQVGTLSMAARLPQIMDSTSSLAATVVTQTPEGRLNATVGNVGDGLVLVIDHQTKKVKYQSGARQFLGYDIFNQGEAYSPMPVQNLSENNLTRVTTAEIGDIHEDDIIIHMTDGVWEEFATAVEIIKEGKETVKEFRIDEDHFHNCIKPIFEQERGEKHGEDEKEPKEKGKEDESETNSHDIYTSAFEVAQCILVATVDSALKKRQNYKNLLADLGTYITRAKEKKFENKEEDEAYTITVWLEEIKEESPPIAERLEAFLEHTQFVAKDFPAIYFIEKFEHWRFGDDSTVSVMQVPNQKVELLRALVENPRNSHKILPRIAAANLTSEDLEFAMQRLQQEKVLVPQSEEIPAQNQSTGRRLHEVPGCLQSDYDPKVCQNAKNIAEEYLKFTQKVQLTTKLALLKEIRILMTGTSADNSADNHDNRLNVKQMAVLFNALRNDPKFYEKVNEGKSKWEKFWGLENTTQWSDTFETIRTKAKQQLFKEFDDLKSNTAKLKLLKWAEKESLFNEHRNNSFFAGAWGRTGAVSEIQSKAKEVSKTTR
jgi:hypothetical protein